MKNTTMYHSEEDYENGVKCEVCGEEIDCDCMQCHKCDSSLDCDTCGLCHSDGWEAGACRSRENDPDYDPFDI